MELEQLEALYPTPADLVKAVQATAVDLGQDEAVKAYQPDGHAVLDQQLRPKKKVVKPTGQKKSDGTDETQETLEEVVRIPLALQKLIVGRAATFLTGSPISLEANTETPEQETLLEVVRKTWRDNKLHFKNRPIAKAMMSEKEVAELWTLEDAPEGYWGELGNANTKKRLRINILKYSEGNRFYPVFNQYRDMVAFGRWYKVKEGDKEIEFLDLYTDSKITNYQKGQSDWAVIKEEANVIGKIPVVYFSQSRSEWQDVQPLIERLEELLSNHGDINDYNGSPILGVKGAITGFAAKGERGKVLQFEDNADAKYITWDHAPESIKLEIENLVDFIYTITQTPNITFKEMKGLGSLSGIAIKLMFMDAHGKAKDKQDGDFGECIQRRVNLLKAAAAKINVSLEKAVGLTITPSFRLFMPDNEIEQTELQGKQLDNLMRATGEKAVLSQQTAIEHNPLVQDIEQELKLLKAQEQENELRIA